MVCLHRLYLIVVFEVRGFLPACRHQYVFKRAQGSLLSSSTWLAGTFAELDGNPRSDQHGRDERQAGCIRAKKSTRWFVERAPVVLLLPCWCPLVPFNAFKHL